MSSIEDYLENPQWAKNWQYATTQAPNGGYYKRWPLTGMNSPMNIWATEYSVLSLKHGTNNPSPYWGSLQNFSPLVTPQVQNDVKECIATTWNGSRCIGKSLYRISEQNANQDRNAYDRSKVQIAPWGPQD